MFFEEALIPPDSGYKNTFLGAIFQGPFIHLLAGSEVKFSSLLSPRNEESEGLSFL